MRVQEKGLCLRSKNKNKLKGKKCKDNMSRIRFKCGETIEHPKPLE